MEKTNREMAVEVLQTYGAMTSKQCANLVNRDFNIHVTPAQMAGALRPLIASGKVGTSKNGTTSVYWYNKERW